MNAGYKNFYPDLINVWAMVVTLSERKVCCIIYNGLCNNSNDFEWICGIISLHYFRPRSTIHRLTYFCDDLTIIVTALCNSVCYSSRILCLMVFTHNKYCAIWEIAFSPTFKLHEPRGRKSKNWQSVYFLFYVSLRIGFSLNFTNSYLQYWISSLGVRII